MKALLDSLKPDDKDRPAALLIDPARLPRHIAIIMDGNGRWANRRALPRVAGHKAGSESVRSVVETSARLGIEILTLYAFSVENWKRPRAEVETLWQLLHSFIGKELPAMMENNIRLRAIGRLEGLPESVRKDLDEVMERTSLNTGLQANIAINYGGRAEIVDAVNALIRDAAREGRGAGFQIDEQAIASRLYTAGLPDPDLLIRTSGELRISNFLLWQIAYSEIFVTPTLWPDFRRGDLLEAILQYQKRDRRFGGLNADQKIRRSSGQRLLEALGTTSK